MDTQRCRTATDTALARDELDDELDTQLPRVSILPSRKA